MSGSTSTSAAAVVDHIRNKGLRGIKRDRRAFSSASCVTEIQVLNCKSSLRIEVKRRVILYFASSDEFLFCAVCGKAYVRCGWLYICFCILCYPLHAQNQSFKKFFCGGGGIKLQK